MSQGQTPKKKPFPLIPVIAVGAVVLILLAGGGFAFAASQESHDTFCGSCHTMPESTFLGRSTAAALPVDLASFHTAQNTACIDCHSGQGIFGRIQAELMGAKNAFKWYTGTAVQPAVLTTPIGDANCLKCHAQVTSQNFSPQEQISVAGVGNGGGGGGFGGRGEEGRANHWHVQLSKWQAASPTAGNCVSCHTGHDATSTSSAGFMNSQNVQDTCNACHQVLRRGD